MTHIKPPAGWGSRSQLHATLNELADLRGNRDGIWNNEDQAPGHHGNFFDRQPIVAKVRSLLGTGISTEDEIAMLREYRVEQESRWNRPVSQLDTNKLSDADLFLAQKTMVLDRLGRTPSDVTEGFVEAAGSVDGQDIAPREVFWQRFKPVGEPSGKVIVVSPGFQETGRNFYEQVDKMNRLGHDVVVMDHQWGGQTEGSAGGLDRGFGVARDVAAIAAFAQGVVESDYPDTANAEVVLFGNSMGAGPGVLGAMMLNDNDRIQLEGPQMPKGVKAVLQAPFLRATDNITNDVLNLASKLPLLNRIKAPSAGVPVLNHDPIGTEKGTQWAVMEDTRAQLRTMSAATPDLETLEDYMDAGMRPQGEIFVVHGKEDPLADAGASEELKERWGDQVNLQLLDSNNHVLEQNPGEQDHAIRGLQNLLGL